MIFQRKSDGGIIMKILILITLLLVTDCKKRRSHDHFAHKSRGHHKRSEFMKLQQDPLYESTNPTDSTEIGSQQNLDSSGDVVEKTSGSSIANHDYSNEGFPTSSSSLADVSAGSLNDEGGLSQSESTLTGSQAGLPNQPAPTSSSGDEVFSESQDSATMSGGTGEVLHAAAQVSGGETPKLPEGGSISSPSETETIKGVQSVVDTPTKVDTAGGSTISDAAATTENQSGSPAASGESFAGTGHPPDSHPSTIADSTAKQGGQSPVPAAGALGTATNTSNQNSDSCANCACGDCNTIEINLPVSCLKCPQCLKCGGKPCVEPGCPSGNATIIDGECGVEKVFHQCCNTFLANLKEIPPCNVFNTNNCKIGNQKIHDNKAMNYIVYLQTHEVYDEQFSKKGSEKADKLRDKIHNFFLRVYADNDFFLDIFGTKFSDVEGHVNAKLMVRFTKEVKGNIYLLFKAVMCDCGCYLFKAKSLKIDVANMTDILEFCPKKCRYATEECLNPSVSNCDPSCCVSLPSPSLLHSSLPMAKLAPSFTMQPVPYMGAPMMPMGGFYNPMPPPPPPPATMPNFPLMCDPKCSVFCSQMCPPMCCNSHFNFKRTNVAKTPGKQVAVNFFQRTPTEE